MPFVFTRGSEQASKAFAFPVGEGEEGPAALQMESYPGLSRPSSVGDTTLQRDKKAVKVCDGDGAWELLLPRLASWASFTSSYRSADRDQDCLYTEGVLNMNLTVLTVKDS